MEEDRSINNWLSREECTALRTIAILSIVVHNFAHKLPGASSENEFGYNVDNSNYFWNNVISSDFFIHLFAYWGHLGVPIFVFLSAYGLSLKYERKDYINLKQFLLSHYKKLFYPLLIGSIVYLFIMYMIGEDISFSLPRIILQCTMLLNLVYSYEQYMTPGPYWYFGMTMQLYIVYIFLVYKKPMKWLLGLTIVSIILLAYLYHDYKVLVWSKCNILGWLLPFAIGIWSIRFDYFSMLSSKKSKVVSLIIFFSFFCLFDRNYYLWLFIPAVVLYIAICFVKLVPINLWKYIRGAGSNSMYIFVVHPIIRDIMLPLVPNMGRYGTMILYIVSTLIIAWLVSQCIKKI